MALPVAGIVGHGAPALDKLAQSHKSCAAAHIATHRIPLPCPTRSPSSSKTPLQRDIFSAEDRQALEKLAPVVWSPSDQRLTEDQAIELLRDATIAVGGWGVPAPSKRLLDACPDLRLWEHSAASVRHLFGPHLADYDLTIATCRQAIGDNVAETTLGCLIMGLRRYMENAAANRPRRAPRPANQKSLIMATVGVVGASAIGRRVIQHLGHIGSRILLYDPYVTPEQAQELGATHCADLAALCAASDAVTLHAPNLPATRKMMAAEHFQAMPDDCVFVNTARGQCVDEDALIAELEKGRLTAFLDVTWPEPAADDSPLRRLPNVHLTTHIAGYPVSNVGRMVVSDIAAYLAGGTPHDVITADMLSTIA